MQTRSRAKNSVGSIKQDQHQVNSKVATQRIASPRQCNSDRRVNTSGAFLKTNKARVRDTTTRYVKDGTLQEEESRQIQVKKEIDEKFTLLVESNENDYEYHCPMCAIQLADLNSFLEHCKQIHDMIQKKTPTGHVDPEPTSDLYCMLCKATYGNVATYRNHQRQLHENKGVDMSTANAITLPDPSNVNNYCQACDKTFAAKNGYWFHLYFAHDIECRPSRQKINHMKVPDIHDPNNYCYACDRNLSSRSMYKSHLQFLHQIVFPNKKSDGPLPDENDPHQFCRVCRKSYSSPGNYRRHLRKQHRMHLKPSYGRKESGILPDPLNPNFYCRACKKTYAATAAYRQHCQYVHLMKLSPLPRDRKRALVTNENNPQYRMKQ